MRQLDIKRVKTVFLKAVLALVVSVFVGFALLLAVYAMPVDKIEKNFIKSVETFKKEGTYPKLVSWCASTLDNYTDSTMLLEAVYDGNESLVEKSLMVKSERIKDRDSTYTVAHYTAMKDGTLAEESYVRTYSRYWHGFLIYLKPLLLFLNYSQIRTLNICIQLLLNIIVVALLIKKGMKQYIVPYVLMLLLIMPWAIGFSLQYSAVFYVFTIGVIILLNFREHKNMLEDYCLLFLGIGIATSYFDLLTYPLLTFGVPIVLYLCMHFGEHTWKKSADALVLLCFWGVGYVGMWAGKWILASAFTDENVIVNALGTIVSRSSHTSQNIVFTLGDVLKKNADYFFDTPFIWLTAAYIIAACLIGVIRKRNSFFTKDSAAFVFVFILPFCWYMGTGNHSYIHNWMTYREFALSAFAVCSWAAYCTSKKNVNLSKVKKAENNAES